MKQPSSHNDSSKEETTVKAVKPSFLTESLDTSRARKHRAKRYTSFVSVMKLALSALALVLIGIVFLLPTLEPEEDAITLEYKKGKTKNQETRMTNPRFLSSDDGNQQYVVTADIAVQPDINSREVDLTNLQADITLKEGQWLSLSAPTGRLNPDTGFLDLQGGIQIYSDNGNQIYAESAHVKLRERIIESKEGMKGHGPLGEFEADRLVAKQLNGTIRFEGNVKMILYP